MISFFVNKKYKVIPIVEFMEGDIPLEYGISPNNNNNLLFSVIVFFYKQNQNTEIDLDKLERGEYNT